MFKIVLTAALAAMLLAAGLGCQGTLPAQQETLLDRNWGRSYETAKYQQMLNPEAGRTQDPIAGLDGEMAEGALGKYRKPPEDSPAKDLGILTVRPRRD